MELNRRLVELTAYIVSEHVAANKVYPRNVPEMIQAVYDSLWTAAHPEVGAVDVEPKTLARNQAGRLITPEGIVSLIDQRKFMSMRRHLTLHGYTPESYRKTFGLPADFPIVHPEYAKKRSALAASFGFGRGGRKRVAD